MRHPTYVLVFLLLHVFPFHSSAQAADKIRVGFPGPAAQFIPLQLAQKNGFLKEEGLETQMIQIRGNVPIAALVNGEIDYYTVIGTGVRAAIRGLPLKLVACYVRGAPPALIVRPEIKSVKELKGKAIGVGAFGDPTEVLGRMMIEHFGLDPEKDVKFIATGDGPSRLAAMKQGLTAATVASAPMDFQAMKMGFIIVARAYELFSFPDSGVVTSVKKIKERPGEVKQVIKAGIKANRYIRANQEGTIQFLMERQKIDREIATATYESVSKAFNEDGSVPEKGLRLVIEENKRLAKVDRDVPVSEVADLSILKEAQKELGIKGK